MTSVMRPFAALLIAALSLCACSRTSEPAAGGEHSWTHPGELRVETWAIPKSLNPLFLTNTSENFLASLAFDELVTVDPQGNDVPDLAQIVPTLANGGISRDGRTITYHLRRGVRWHDGVPFTSADVKFSWQAVMNVRNNVIERRGYDQVSSVETPDAYTVVFHLKQPFAPFIDTVFGESDDPYRIVPKHLLDKYADLNHVSYNTHPVGTGPFRIAHWTQGEEIVFEANDAYFRGKPKLRRIVVKFVTDDNTREQDLRSHESDLANDISPASIRNMRGSPDLREVLSSAPAYTSLHMNLTHAPLDDVRVRRAISYATDATALLRDDMYDTAEPATEDLARYYWAYDDALPPHVFDLSRARQSLESAGWHGAPGAIRQKNGRPLQLELAFQVGNPSYQHIAVQLQSLFRQAGIDLQIKPYNPTLLYEAQPLGGILTSGKFDLAIYPWISGADPDDSQQWMRAYIPPAGNNIAHYANPAFDTAEGAALGTFDRTLRKRAYAKIQGMLATDLPAVFLFYQKRNYVVNPDLKNFAPNGVSEGWNAFDWSI